MLRVSRWSIFAGIVVAAVAAYAVLSSVNANAQQTVGKWWPVAEQISIDRIDHSALDGLLQKHVDRDGRVNYSAWHASADDRLALQNYLKHLSRADIKRTASRANRLAYWINAYNAVTLEGILQVYPTSSIRNHTARVVGYNIWQDLKLPVGTGAKGGASWSLEQIEHEILRKMDEPRIHFAIVCASIGCPRLLNEAYTGDQLEQQLQKNTRDFFSRPQNLVIDQPAGRLKLSSILKWFAEDFGETSREQVATIAPYFPDAARALVQSGDYRVSYLPYDWDLNDRK